MMLSLWSSKITDFQPYDVINVKSGKKALFGISEACFVKG